MSNVGRQNCRKPRMRDGFQMASRDDDGDDLHSHEEEDDLHRRSTICFTVLPRCGFVWTRLDGAVSMVLMA